MCVLFLPSLLQICRSSFLILIVLYQIIVLAAWQYTLFSLHTFHLSVNINQSFWLGFEIEPDILVSEEGVFLIKSGNSSNTIRAWNLA